MAGFFLDTVIEYISRIIFRALQKLQSMRWKRCRATVVGVELRPWASLGCSLVKITYRPEHQTAEYSSRIPFLLQGTAEDYAHSVPDAITIRSKPGRQSRTVFFPADQY
jgi:hypothetical protein